MNILIIGDSWALSPSWAPSSQYKWLEFALIDLGHTVFNRAKGGGQNCQNLNDCIYFLENTKDKIKIDLIIWLHTELIRDINLHECEGYDSKEQRTTLEQIFDYIEDYTAQRASEARKLTSAKWAIIGGHAPIRSPEKFSWAEFFIRDWRSQLVGEQLPASQSLSGLSWLNDNIELVGKDTVRSEIEKYEQIVKIGEKMTPSIFFDGVHPTARQSEELATQIHNFFNSSA
jgi:hypothetical protein